VIQSQPGCDRKWFATSKPLYRREKNLLLQPYVLEQSPPKLAECIRIDIRGIAAGAGEQLIEALVVAFEEAPDCLFAFH